MNLSKKGNKIWAKDQSDLTRVKPPLNNSLYFKDTNVASGETAYQLVQPNCTTLHVCTAVLRAISHIVNALDSGYAKYQKNGWITQYRPYPDVCITTLSNDGKAMNTTLSCTDKNGVISNTNFDDFPDAWFFHVLIGIKLGILDEGQYSCTNIKRTIDDFVKVALMGNFESTYTQKDVVVFTNDVYAHCLMKGYDIDDFALLSKANPINKADLSQISGNLQIEDGASLCNSQKAPTLQKLMGKYTVGSSTNTSEKYDQFVVCPEVEQVCKILKANALGKTSIPQNFLFTGVAGTGKSSAAYMIARACNLNYSFVVGSENLTMDELLVNTTLGDKPGEIIKVESPLVKAFREGGVIEFQEANCIKRPNVIQFLNPLLDDNGELQLSTGERLIRHPNTVIIFTANVGYEGTKGMNQALLSRCSAKFEFELPNDSTLIKRLVNRSGIAKEIAAKMIKVMHSVNKVLEESGYTDGCCSYREVENWAKMSMMFGNIYESAGFTIVNSATNDVDGRAEVTEAILTQFTQNEVVDDVIDLNA